MICSRERITRGAGSEKPISIPKTFTIEVIEHVQSSEFTAVPELVTQGSARLFYKTLQTPLTKFGLVMLVDAAGLVARDEVACMA